MLVVLKSNHNIFDKKLFLSYCVSMCFVAVSRIESILMDCELACIGVAVI